MVPACEPCVPCAVPAVRLGSVLSADELSAFIPVALELSTEVFSFVPASELSVFIPVTSALSTEVFSIVPAGELSVFVPLALEYESRSNAVIQRGPDDGCLHQGAQFNYV